MEKGKRYNTGKLRYELLPVNPIKEIVKVYTNGAHKYTVYEDDNGNKILGKDIPLEEVANRKLKVVEDGADNWRKGMSWSETIACAERHIVAWKNGEDVDLDPIMKTQHLANAAWNIIAVLEFTKTHPEFDDRRQWYKSPFKKVFLDLDGVVVDFENSFLEYFNLPNYPSIDWNDWRFRENMSKVSSDENFWLNCKPLIEPKDIVYPISGYCTSRSCSNETIYNWLKNNGFPICEVINVGYNESKTEALKEKCDIFLDDSIRNFVELNSNGILTYLMTRPHNIKYNAGNLRINFIKDFFDNLTYR